MRILWIECLYARTSAFPAQQHPAVLPPSHLAAATPDPSPPLPMRSSPSASSTLNAIKAAKEKAAAAAAAEKAAKTASLASASACESTHASGWWATTEQGKMDAILDAADNKKPKGFAVQYGVTGQTGGIGSSLFNIQRDPTTTA
jgi:hypothetical protein